MTESLGAIGGRTPQSLQLTQEHCKNLINYPELFAIFTNDLDIRQKIIDKDKASLTIMEKFDVDGDGNLDKNEIAAYKEYVISDEIEKAKAEFDIDGDGKLNEKEKAAFEAYKSGKGNDVSYVNDLKAEHERLEKAQKKLDLMKKFDIDGNGRLDENERKAYNAYNEEKENPFVIRYITAEYFEKD